MNRAVAAVLVVTLAAGVIATALVASREAANAPPAGPRVELTAVRTENWTGPDGKTVTMVCADWRSVGERPVRRVTAKVAVVDDVGEVVFAAEGVVVYAAPAGSAGVGTGETYVEPPGEGVPLPGVAEAAVEITGVSGLTTAASWQSPVSSMSRSASAQRAPPSAESRSTALSSPSSVPSIPSPISTSSGTPARKLTHATARAKRASSGDSSTSSPWSGSSVS